MTDKTQPVSQKSKNQQNDVNDLYSEVHEAYEKVVGYIENTERGFWGTECEAAFATVESDLASAMEQLEFIRRQLGGR